MLTEISIFILTSLVGYYLYTYKKIHYLFQENGIEFLPGLPVFGNALKSTLSRNHLIEDLDIVYKAFPEERYVGYIDLTSPAILVRDPELIKQITVKDFDHFVDHKEYFNEELEPLFGVSLIMMKGDKWRDMRTTLSPAFTGSKIRLMMPFMIEITKNIVEHLKDHLDAEVDIDDVIRRYATDVTASTAFGLQVNSVKERDNEFFKMGESLFNFTLTQKLIFLAESMFPMFLKMLKIRLFPESTIHFFKDIVTSTMKQREKDNTVRPDMIQLLLETVKGTHNGKSATETEGEKDLQKEMKNATVKKWTQNELAGQVFMFFAAGFESSSATITLLLHELALNPGVQEKLYQEAKDFEETTHNLTYDNIVQLKYLDCVVNEIMRKWSTAIVMDRVVTKPYELPPPHEGGKPYKLKPGDLIYNVINSIHMDPQYYPDPDVFNPERFSEENRHNIKPFTFLPFGTGPRTCIATRFALIEMKVLVYYVILNYKILKCNKTQDPIKLKPLILNVKVLGGSWVKFEARK